MGRAGVAKCRSFVKVQRVGSRRGSSQIGSQEYISKVKFGFIFSDAFFLFCCNLYISTTSTGKFGELISD